MVCLQLAKGNIKLEKIGQLWRDSSLCPILKANLRLCRQPFTLSSRQHYPHGQPKLDLSF